jgi:hypothetical protein
MATTSLIKDPHLVVGKWPAMWSHTVASDLSMAGSKKQTVSAPKMAEGLCAKKLLGLAR